MSLLSGGVSFAWTRCLQGLDMECPRCGGFTVAERFYGSNLATGAWTYDGLRCVNCGAIIFLTPKTRSGVLTTERPLDREESTA